MGGLVWQGVWRGTLSPRFPLSPPFAAAIRGGLDAQEGAMREWQQLPLGDAAVQVLVALEGEVCVTY